MTVRTNGDGRSIRPKVWGFFNADVKSINDRMDVSGRMQTRVHTRLGVKLVFITTSAASFASGAIQSAAV